MKTLAEATKMVCHRGAGNETAVFCRGSLCMAWQTHGEPMVRLENGSTISKTIAEELKWNIVEELLIQGDCRLLQGSV